MRTLGGPSALLAVMLLSLPAVAEDQAAPAAPEAQPPTAPACEAHFVCRFTTDLLSRIFGGVREELGRSAEPDAEAFDAKFQRYLKFQEFNQKLLDERATRDGQGDAKPEAEAFDARFQRYLKFQEFNRKLLEEQATRDERAFDAEIALTLRKIAFTKKLATERRAAQIQDAPPVDPRPSLYRRE